MSRIRVPIPQKITAKNWFAKDFDTVNGREIKYTVAERHVDEIKELIDKIYNKFQDELEEGNKPAYIMINKLDYSFLQAYYDYYLREPYNSYMTIDCSNGRKLKTIFGLKLVLTSSNLFRIGWEP